jgi:type I restriction enzyme R subunit
VFKPTSAHSAHDSNPKIVVTVDLLTTGIDVPSITNLVFLRRVKSRILYEQMLGRATRLCPDIGKETFRIFRHGKSN